MSNPKILARAILSTFFLFAALSTVQAQEAVDPQSGRLSVSVTDLVVAAGPVNLEVQRTLQPDRGESGLLGARWRLNFEKRLIKEKNRVRIETEQGPVFFTQEGNQPEYKNDIGGRIRLEKSGQAVWLKSDGTLETYDKEGRLTEIDFRNFNKAFLIYGPDKRLAGIEGPRKQTLKFASDPRGRIVRIESSTGDVITYQYTKQELVRVQVNGGSPIGYHYNANGLLSRIENPRTGPVEMTYDAQGRVVTRRFADGGQERHTYPGEGNEHGSIDPSGGVTKRKWSDDGAREEVIDALGHQTLIEKNAWGLPVSITDPLGNKTQMAYDSRGRMVSLTDGAGRTTRFEYLRDTVFRSAIVRPDGSRQTNQYDGQLNLIEVRRGNQTIFQQTYYPDGSVKSIKELGNPEERYTYDQAGRLSTRGNALGQQTRFEYDPLGNLIRMTNPLGGVTAFKYDQQRQLTSITDPAMATTRYESNPRGSLARVIDPMGRVKSYGYDERGRLLTVNDPSGGTIRNEYDREGRIVRKLFPDNQDYRFAYDLAGNVLEETNTLGQARRFTRDPLGRIIKESTASGQEMIYEYDPMDNLIAWKDNLGSGENLKYNPDGQLIERTTTQGASTRFTYDSAGNLISMHDSLGKVKRFAYTRTGELLQAAEPDGSISGYTYDFTGRLSTIKHPGGGESRVIFDPAGNLIGSMNPLGKTRKKTYDPTGRLVSQTDAKGQATKFIYDGSGQMVEKQLPDKTKVTYQYGPSGNLVQADDGQFPLRFTYHPSGFLTKVEYPAIKQNLMYTYDATGLLQTLKDRDGNQIAYKYNGLKQLIAIVLPNLKEIRFSYTSKNLLLSVGYPNGITGQWDYDSSDRIIKFSYQDKGGKIVAGWTYTYDPAGNIVEQKTNQGYTSYFTYDPAGQLIEETSPEKKIQYRYGPGGNRSSVKENGSILHYQHDKADRIIKAGEENFIYDENGNLIHRKDSKTQTSYEYNAENRLIKVSRSDGNTTGFGYAPTGERVWRRDSQGLTYFIYDGHNLIQELGEKGNPKIIYVHGPGIDRPLAMLRDGQWYFYHADRLGSIRLLTDSRGEIATAYEYDAFGKIRSQQGSISNPFTYAGREREKGQDLYYYRARYYDPQIGRFLSPDVMPPNLGKPFSLNPYLYARNNPLRFVDPLGLDWFEPIKNVGIWDTPEECLEYWRMIKSRPDNPNHSMADQMIESTEKYIRDQGRRVPPPPNPTPAGGGGNLENPAGGSAGGNRPGTIKVGAPAGENRPGTIRVNAPGPGGANAPSSGPGGITRPGFYGAVGGVVGAVGTYVNLQACLDEGRSKAYCYGQFGLIAGVGVGVGVLLAPAILAGGTAATAITVGGAALAGAGALAAGNRWSQAPETRAQLEQQAAQQAQAEARVKKILANLEGRIGALSLLGQQFCTAQSKANDSALKAKGAADKSKKNIESAMTGLSAEVTGNLTNSCIQDQTKLKDLPEKIRQAEEWIDKAGQAYPEAIRRLTRCASQKDIDDADELLKAATAMGLSGERKTREALADIDALQKSIPKLKEKVKEIRDKMGNLENTFIANQQEVDNYGSDTETFATEAEGIIARFNTLKAELQQSASNLEVAIPPQFQDDLTTLKMKIKNIDPPCAVKSQDEYRNMAKAAKESISGGSLSSLGGIGSMLSTGSLAVQKLAIDSALDTCGGLNPPTGQETDKASLALVKLTDKIQAWLKTIADYRGRCLAKLYSKPQTMVPPTTSTTIQPSTSAGPAVPPPPPKTPPGPKKLTALAVDCPKQASVGDTVQCTAVGIYEGDSPTEVTNQVTWTPYTSRFTVTRKPESGFISVAYSYLGFSGTVSIKMEDKTGSGAPAIPPPPPPPPPGPQKLITFVWECYPQQQVRVGGSVQCKALAQFEGESNLKDVTAQATWTPGASFTAPPVKPESGLITVTVTYWGERGTKYIRVTDYDPRDDPSLPGKNKPVDTDKVKELAGNFQQGQWKPIDTRNQNVKNQPPAQPQPPGYLSSTTTTTPTTIPPESTTIPTTTVPPGVTTIPTTTVPPRTTTPTTIRPGTTTTTTTTTGGGSTSQKYAVFLVLNVFGGAGYSVVVCEVGSTFLQGKEYQKKSIDFNTKKEADKAYCDALESNPRSIVLTGGSKAKIYGGDYWVGEGTPACPKKP